MFDEVITFQTYCFIWKFQKKHNKIKEPSITCNYIWHIVTPKWAYWLDTHSVKVWWSYMLPNTNTVNFCDIIFRHRAIFSACPNKESRKSKNCQVWYFLLEKQTKISIKFRHFSKKIKLNNVQKNFIESRYFISVFRF